MRVVLIKKAALKSPSWVLRRRPPGGARPPPSSGPQMHANGRGPLALGLIAVVQSPAHIDCALGLIARSAANSARISAQISARQR